MSKGRKLRDVKETIFHFLWHYFLLTESIKSMDNLDVKTQLVKLSLHSKEVSSGEKFFLISSVHLILIFLSTTKEKLLAKLAKLEDKNIHKRKSK